MRLSVSVGPSSPHKPVTILLCNALLNPISLPCRGLAVFTVCSDSVHLCDLQSDFSEKAKL